MIVSPDILRRDTVAVMKRIDEQLAIADKVGFNDAPEVMGPLLLAKVQALNTLVLLQEKK